MANGKLETEGTVTIDPDPICATSLMNGYQVHIRSTIIPSAGEFLGSTPTYALYVGTTQLTSGSMQPDGPLKWKADPFASVLPDLAKVTAMFFDQQYRATTVVKSATVNECSAAALRQAAERSSEEIIITSVDFELSAKIVSGNTIVTATITEGNAIRAYALMFDGSLSEIPPEEKMEPKDDDKTLFKKKFKDEAAAKVRVRVQFEGGIEVTKDVDCEPE